MKQREREKIVDGCSGSTSRARSKFRNTQNIHNCFAFYFIFFIYKNYIFFFNKLVIKI